VRAVADFNVVDESDDWIVVDKPAPLVVHPANRKVESTLLGGLQALLMYDLANGGSLSILTRLDRETSGLVLVAKRTAAARHFSRQLERREMDKAYLAIVHGWPDWEYFTLDAPILRLGEVQDSPIWLRQGVHPAGRECITSFRVERRFANIHGNFALIHCRPETGRMHQIRVHLEHLGHPLVGDKIYGTDGSPYLEKFANDLSGESSARLILPRHALHACDLSAEWQGARLEWHSLLPRDLARFCEPIEVADAHGKLG
jgi:23S rRNA pseudouridine1911/1915/1917 synthase